MVSKAWGPGWPISVVIPVRNRSAQLQKCLQALIENDLSDTEVLVVDDASEEPLRPTVESFSAAAPVRYLRLDRHSGPGAARNRGLSEALFPWVLFLDGDVQLPQKSLHWMRESLDLYSHRQDVAGVLGCYCEELPWREEFFTNFKNLSTCFLYHRTETLSPYLHTPILCIQKELLRRCGGFEAQVATAEDFRLGLRLGSQGYRFVIDRRVRGLHLKRYTLGQILEEDWRRICDLKSVRPGKQRKFYYQALRWGRLVSLFLPGPTLVAAVLIPWVAGSGWWALIGFLLFLLINLRFLAYTRRHLGWVFSAGAALFLFAEMLWAEAALLLSVFYKHPTVWRTGVTRPS